MSVSTVEGGIRHARKVITAINVQSVRRPFSRRNSHRESPTAGAPLECARKVARLGQSPRYRFSPNPPMDGVRTAEGG